VKPETVIAWHRKGFRLFWAWNSRRRGGRPKIDAEIRALIRQMAEQNRRGAPRIHGELLKPGFEVSQADGTANGRSLPGGHGTEVRDPLPFPGKGYADVACDRTAGPGRDRRPPPGWWATPPIHSPGSLTDSSPQRRSRNFNR